MRCPNCGAEVPPDALRCPNCGVMLGIAAAGELQRITKSLPEQKTPPPLEALVPRIGEVLISKGLIDKTQLNQALKFQEEKAVAGENILLGNALVELGFISQAELDRAIAEQIFKLQEELKKANTLLEQKVAERTRELSQALKRVRELAHAKDNFIDAVSHELRTPLTQIIGYLDLCYEGTLGELSAEQKYAVEVMMRSAHRLHTLIENLIRYSLLAAGELRPKIEAVEVGNLITPAVTANKNAAKEKQIRLTVDMKPEIAAVSVLAEEQTIVWAIQHLIDNAVKFNGKGGEVHIKVEQFCHKIHFVIYDNGSGILPEKLTTVLEALSQVEEVLTRKHGGLGLGLALTAEILKAHNTFLELHSEHKKGSVFSFALEIAPGQDTIHPSACFRIAEPRLL